MQHGIRLQLIYLSTSANVSSCCGLLFKVSGYHTVAKNHVSRCDQSTENHIFARFGIQLQLLTDNGPQFASGEFQQFVKYWRFEHITTSPHYPQANGQIERTVQTIKRMLKKCEQENVDSSIALLHYRNTSHG